MMSASLVLQAPTVAAQDSRLVSFALLATSPGKREACCVKRVGATSPLRHHSQPWRGLRFMAVWSTPTLQVQHHRTCVAVIRTRGLKATVSVSLVETAWCAKEWEMSSLSTGTSVRMQACPSSGVIQTAPIAPEGCRAKHVHQGGQGWLARNVSLARPLQQVVAVASVGAMTLHHWRYLASVASFCWFLCTVSLTHQSELARVTPLCWLVLHLASLSQSHNNLEQLACCQWSGRSP
mmetsp:Transcript_26074/g.60245  ORF Transcript_26074/g.60245 Transcript_26074/m.60245 type:complete len:236 (+) Transcript_26074:231-938(+)